MCSLFETVLVKWSGVWSSDGMVQLCGAECGSGIVQLSAVLVM